MIYVNGAPVHIARFPNGEARITTPRRCCTETFVRLHYESDSDLVHLAMVADHLSEDGRHLSYLDIDYMPYSRMDRHVPGMLFTLRTVADMINALGFEHVRVNEPHSDVTCALLRHSVPFSSVERLLPAVQKTIGFDRDDWLVFPDAGAEKRYVELGGRALTGIKHRDLSTGQIVRLDLAGMPEGEMGYGRKALIVDDLCSYGGTFIRCADTLLDGFGFDKVYLLVAHLEPAVYDGDLLGMVEGVFATNSLQTESTHSKVQLFPVPYESV